MRYILENDTLRVEIESFGAEIKSVKRKADGREYMWCGDPEYWGRTSPVLFPFVGAPKNKEYRYEGRTYPMGQHGFARDMEFALEAQEGKSIWFVLSSTEETYAKYPFRFRLHIGYMLDENEVSVHWKVDNTDEKPMYFSIGAHPAFLCPINGEQDKTGYRLRFGNLTDRLHHHGNTPDGMAVMTDEELELEDGEAVITPGFFDKCTYMVEGAQTGEVSILDRDGEAYVTVRFDAPLFALWSPEGKEAPFLCIEPWYGRCDAVDFEGSLAERPWLAVADSRRLFAVSGFGTAVSGGKLQIPSGRGNPAPVHGILQGSAGCSICGAFTDLVGSFPAGCGSLLFSGVSEYLSEHTGRLKKCGRRTDRDGRSVSSAVCHPLFLYLPSGIKAIPAQRISIIPGNELEIRSGSGSDRYAVAFHRRSTVSGEDLPRYGGSVCLDGSDHCA